MKHKDEYHARLWYEENRWRHKPRIWVVSQLASPFIWNDGTIDLMTVRGNTPVVARQKYSGTPRWCEWGQDISDLKVEVSVFQAMYMYYYKGDELKLLAQVYCESTALEDKARNLMSQMLLRYK